MFLKRKGGRVTSKKVKKRTGPTPQISFLKKRRNQCVHAHPRSLTHIQMWSKNKTKCGRGGKRITITFTRVINNLIGFILPFLRSVNQVKISRSAGIPIDVQPSGITMSTRSHRTTPAPRPPRPPRSFIIPQGLDPGVSLTHHCRFRSIITSNYV